MRNLSKKFTFIVLGRSGSGKGTQAHYILARLGETSRHVETGRFLRDIIEEPNPTTDIARRIMKEGRLFPGWFGAYTWLRQLIERGYAEFHLVVDGAPRRVSEAMLMDEVIEWHKRPAPLCIYVDVSEREATRRLLGRGRNDDNATAIRHRMAFFKEDMLPVVDYYKKKSRLIRINGERPIEEVWKEIDVALKTRLGTIWPSKSKQKKNLK